MRERVALYNGTLRTGPLPGGGYQVTATLPLSSLRVADQAAPAAPAAHPQPAAHVPGSAA